MNIMALLTATTTATVVAVSGAAGTTTDLSREYNLGPLPIVEILGEPERHALPTSRSRVLQAEIGPLVVDVVWDDGQFVASHAESGFFGEGDTPAESLDDLLVSMRALHSTLSPREGHLSEHMQKQYRYLQAALSA